jgi:hypothetical protein
MKVRRLGMHFAGMVLRGAGILCKRPLHIPARATVAGASAERKHRIELRIGQAGVTSPLDLLADIKPEEVEAAVTVTRQARTIARFL